MAYVLAWTSLLVHVASDSFRCNKRGRRSCGDKSSFAFISFEISLYCLFSPLNFVPGSWLEWWTVWLCGSLWCTERTPRPTFHLVHMCSVGVDAFDIWKLVVNVLHGNCMMAWWAVFAGGGEGGCQVQWKEVNGCFIGKLTLWTAHEHNHPPYTTYPSAQSLLLHTVMDRCHGSLLCFLQLHMIVSLQAYKMKNITWIMSTTQFD